MQFHNNGTSKMYLELEQDKEFEYSYQNVYFPTCDVQNIFDAF